MHSFYNLVAIDDLYGRYLRKEETLDRSWQYFFEGLSLGQQMATPFSMGDLTTVIWKIIEAYRLYGHLVATCNPLDKEPKKRIDELSLEVFSLKKSDLDREVPSCSLFYEKKISLSKLIFTLEEIYCSNIGFEFVQQSTPTMKAAIEKEIEEVMRKKLTIEEKIAILRDLRKAELFEIFLHTKYTGQTRFSLQGAETLIPLMRHVVQRAASNRVSNIVVGMAHRGRLNVLAHILEKPYGSIFQAFEDTYTPDEEEGSGDVKYHMGYQAKLHIQSGEPISITLCANPSHLESIDPVVEGAARAFGDALDISGSRQKEILPLLIHGDASIAGQGVVYETMQMGLLRGYATKGTIHVVINNQIGYTTTPKEGRSTRYCTDIAKTFSSPTFHVNGEDPEACYKAALLAVFIRQQFGIDVFIDLLCYRLHGHNEGDEPSFTQPLEYKEIRSKEGIGTIYGKRLIEEGVITGREIEEMDEEIKKQFGEEPTSFPKALPKKIVEKKVVTAVSISSLRSIGKLIFQIPKEIILHPKLERLLQERMEMVQKEEHLFCIDWAVAEALCFASLLEEDVSIRLSGQDVVRGTFAHRHATLIDQTKEKTYTPLASFRDASSHFCIYNSFLSEFAVLGFEFGYSLAASNTLVIWEAQYGDFANGAQVIIDQYLASAEQKWNLASSLTLFLPHGYTGQGPEHSSARIERFLQLAAEDNMRIANVTTPVQLFHLLRFQALTERKKPLILFTPKALLRHPLVVSPLIEFEKGVFQQVLDDPKEPKMAKTIVFCSGQIYYELLVSMEKRKVKENYALVRIEMLYPFDESGITALIEKYKAAQKIVWVQEEPHNMGPYFFLKPRIDSILEKLQKPLLQYIGRKEGASTAAGSHRLHKKQHEAILKELFEEEK